MLARMNGWIDERLCSSACLDNLTFKGRDFTGHRSSLCHRPCYFQLHSIVIKDFKAPWKLCFAQVGFCSVKSWYFCLLYPGKSESGCPSLFYFAHWDLGNL